MKSPGAIEAQPLAARSSAEGAEGDVATMFERLDADRTGIDFVHTWNPPAKYDHEITNSTPGGGVAIGDYDNDGRPDIYLTQPFGMGNRLYRNLGGFRFEDVTQSAGVDDGGAWGAGATFVDIDNDGDLDLYVCGYDCPNRLFINNGDGAFTERAAAYGLDFSGASVMMAFADMENDGLLDGYLLTNRLEDGKTSHEIEAVRDADGVPRVVEAQREMFDILIRPDGREWMIEAGQYDYVYRNLGDRFAPGVKAGGNFLGLGAVWLDYNGDRFPDLYVANDYYGPDQLMRNDGDGGFESVGGEALPHTPWYSMGADAADLNNDGRIDLLASDMAGTTHFKSKLSMGNMDENWFLNYPTPAQYMRNAVYINTGTDRFVEAAFLTKLAKSDWTWSPKFADLDCDGWTDLFVTNGMTRDWFNSDLQAKFGRGSWTGETREGWLDTPMRAEPNLAFRNKGDLKFVHAERQWGLDFIGVSFGAAMGDLDGDGDLDVVVNNFEAPALVYRNNASDGHRAVVRLVGTVSNSCGIGAKVVATTPSGDITRYLNLAQGYMSSNDPRVYLGLGEHERIDRLTVEWPSGHTQVFLDVEADRLYTITEPDGPPSKAKRAAPNTMFESAGELAGVRHHERSFDDFQRQPLLPYQHSRLGPGMAWGDIDGDGDDDAYLGGGAGSPGTLLINDAGGFTPRPQDAIRADLACEDMSPLLFDADGDGDLDLYVVSGGVECEPDADVLRDRLYLNDGEANFERASPSCLPVTRHSGSVAAAADFDRDGDLDLFVGGRVVPGQYPLSPGSRLLVNDGGTFTDATATVAMGLAKAERATAALWSDVDNDGWVDLLVTCEWGPVRLFRNREGTLVDATADAHLAERLGWWNSIAGADVDHDGDIDYVVTNAGLNTKYHASPQRPVLVYYGDMDGTGKANLIEAKFEGDICYPGRGRSCSSNAMPMLKSKFPTFEKFALAPLEKVYTPGKLDKARRFEANTLKSGVLINDGEGRFAFRPLPRIAQVSPGYGVVVTDVNSDGHADIYMVQNFFGPQVETGRWDGGVSQLLLGDGTGAFEPVWPDESGLVVPQDATALSAIDLNGDARPDFAIATNNGPVLTFLNTTHAAGGGTGEGHVARVPLAVRLRGPAGNPTAVGARVTLTSGDTSQAREVHAGSGYLTQQPATLFFTRDDGDATLTVRWPNGETSSHPVDSSDATTVITRE